ncbi:MAG: hypothetical protein DRQ37_02705 [Gammaproteobacteria bacterium]|nr:MAG: hypothetical protein DRQ37_02705 [Gammaproteobacteria bacterium]
MLQQGMDAEHLCFQDSCHSVTEAADTAGCAPQELVKNVCLVASDAQIIVAIVRGTDRVSTTRVGKALGTERPRTATPAEILDATGYPCGGTPSFGYQAIFLVDPKVMEVSTVYSGGGSTRALVRVGTESLLADNGGRVVRIRR